MTETVRCWLVERSYDDKGLIRIVYVPTDASGQHVTEKAAVTDPDATAAIEVAPDELDPIDEEHADRYAQEAARMAERHEPDEPI